MKRKLVKQGSSTLMVSLPSKWVKQNSLGKGSEVDIELSNGKDLLIRTEYRVKIKETKIKLTSSTESSIRTAITNVYRLGYDKLHITLNKPSDLEIIRQTLTNQLIGYEITDRKETFCLIENITEPSAEQADKVLLKVFFGISELINSVEEMLNGEDKSDYIKELEQKIYQYDNFVRRVRSSELSEKISIQWAFHNQLIHAQREVFFIAKFLEHKKFKASKETLTLFKSLKQMFEALKEGFLKKDIKMLERIHELEKKMVLDDGYRALRKSSGDETIILYRITSAIRGFYLCASPLLGMFLWSEN